MNKKEETIYTYNTAAERMVLKFARTGARVNDILETLAVVKKEQPFVVEIGCANGRDAKEIIRHTVHYLGFDVASQFIQLAKEYVPEAQFMVSDVETFIFPEHIDVVFAFASLIHVPKESLKEIVERVYAALNTGGVLRISMKYADTYSEVTKEDEYGTRTYYHYSEDDLLKIASRFTVLKNERVEMNGQSWVELLLQK